MRHEYHYNTKQCHRQVDETYNIYCSAKDGTYHCGCDPGYELQADGHSCVMKSSCDSECENNGRCFEGRCICTSNFEGERCEQDKNECLDPSFQHGCTHQCVNTYGSYECICPLGYRRLADKRTCVNVYKKYLSIL
ncbi:unnamed protein product [Trichobilharzia regenti]|nr:unnamed protein product [Trichobilharzia regenti]